MKSEQIRKDLKKEFKSNYHRLIRDQFDDELLNTLVRVVHSELNITILWRVNGIIENSLQEEFRNN